GPFSLETERYGAWMGPTIAIIRPCDVHVAAGIPDSIAIASVRAHPLVRWGVDLRGEARITPSLVATVTRSRIHNANKKVIDVETAPAAQFESGSVDYYPQPLRLSLAWRL